MGGALSLAVTGCDVVNGGGEASDGGAVMVVSSTGVDGESGALDIVWIDVTVRIGRRILDLWSGNSVQRAWWGENCICRGPTVDDFVLRKCGRVQCIYPGTGGLVMRMGGRRMGRGKRRQLLRAVLLFCLLLFAIPSTALTALSPDALAISQILRRRGGTGGFSEAEGKVVPLVGQFPVLAVVSGEGVS